MLSVFERKDFKDFIWSSIVSGAYCRIVLQILIKSILFSDKNIFSPVCIFFTKNMIPIPKIYSIVVTKKKSVLASIMFKYPFLKNNGKSMNRFAQYIVVQIASRLNSFFSRVLSFIFTRNPLFIYFFAFKQYYIRTLFNIPCIFCNLYTIKNIFFQPTEKVCHQLRSS